MKILVLIFLGASGFSLAPKLSYVRSAPMPPIACEAASKVDVSSFKGTGQKFVYAYCEDAHHTIEKSTREKYWP